MFILVWIIPPKLVAKRRIKINIQRRLSYILHSSLVCVDAREKARIGLRIRFIAPGVGGEGLGLGVDEGLGIKV